VGSGLLPQAPCLLRAHGLHPAGARRPLPRRRRRDAAAAAAEGRRGLALGPVAHRRRLLRVVPRGRDLRQRARSLLAPASAAWATARPTGRCPGPSR
jgi:hypothetical protein